MSEIFQRKLFLFLIILIVSLGIAIRSVELMNKNYLFDHDQGRDFLLSREILQGNLRLIGTEVGSGVAGISGIFHGPGHYYLLAFFMYLFGGDPYGSIVYMWLFGVGTLVVSTFFLVELFGIKYALLPITLLSVSPSLVPQSRFLWNPHPASLFIILAFWSIYRSKISPNLYLPLAMLFSGITYHFQLGIAVPLMTAVFIYALGLTKCRKVKLYLVLLFTILFCLSPLIVFNMRNSYISLQGLKHFGSVNGSSIFESTRLSMHIRDYWNDFKDSFRWPDNVSDSIKVLIFAFMFLAVFFSRTMNKYKSVHALLDFLALVSVVSYGGYLLLNNVVWNYYLIHLQIAYPIMISIGAYILLETKYIKYIAFGVISLLFTFSIFGGFTRLVTDYTVDIYDYGGGVKIQGKIDVIDYIFEDAKGQKFDTFPLVIWEPWEYLLDWYGRKKYGYVPGRSQEKLYYVFVNPAKDLPWNSFHWLETELPGGKVIANMTHEKSSIIIQKRIGDKYNQ